MMRLAILALLGVGLAGAAAAQRPTAERAAQTEQEYRATLARLGLAGLRQGANGQDASAPNAVNYTESRVKPVRLPPLLASKAGPIRTPTHWRRFRRPELITLFEEEMYGRVPPTAPEIRWDLVRTEQRRVGQFAAQTLHYRGRASRAADHELAIELSLTLPTATAGRVPLILELGFPEGFRFPGAPPAPSPDWREQILARGWAYAIIVPSTVQPDDGAGLSKGVIGLASGGRSRGPHDWGALRAWAWGASRAMDLIEKDRRVDPRRVAVEGLSRYGKAALVAMAFDERFSVGFIGSSGAGGAKLLRRDYGERLENLTASGEYHWFAPNFLRYGGPKTVNDLPVDAHGLIALAAPRPLFIGAGRFDQDNWVDPRGSFEAGLAASPVYRLHGARPLTGPYPGINECRCSGTIAFRQHEGGHSNMLNWPAFLDFAAREWRLSPKASPRG